MGLFSKIKKAVKGIFKGVKKVVSGIVKLGKKLVKGVGKFFGKLGPIGTLAIGIIAPYALSALAGAGAGWVSTAAQKALEFGSMVKSAVAAPFKALGQVAGKGISALGQASGSEAFMSVTDQIANGLGYTGGSVSEGVKNIFGDVANEYNILVGNTASPSNLGAGLPSTTIEDVKFSGEGEAAFKGEGLFGKGDPLTSGSVADVDVTKWQPDQMGYFADQSSPLSEGQPGFEVQVNNQGFTGLTDAEKLSFGEAEPSLFDRLKKGLSSFGTPGAGEYSPVKPIEESGYEPLQAQGGEPGGGSGGLGRSFYAQNLTGLDPTEEYAQMMAQGLFGNRRGYA